MEANMTRRAFMGTIGITSAALAACGNNGASSTSGSAGNSAAGDGTTITGTYTRHIQGFDWGCGIDKVTLTLSAPLDAVDPSDFDVSETKMATDFTKDSFPIVEVTIPRIVNSAVINDDGTVDLELECTPDDGDSPLTFSMITQLNTWSNPYYLTIGMAKDASLTSNGKAVSALQIETKETDTTTSADKWTIDVYSAADGTNYAFASWDPAQESKTLVVWLHGLGEGGTANTDPRVTILANKVVALSEDDFQQKVGGAHILAPQCPTYWMDSDGKMSNFQNGAIDENGTSFYTASLEELIDAHAKKVGAEKIVLAGCSNGGFMTMILSISRPGAYAAVVPICEALKNENITDEQIVSLRDLPMYFVYSKDDTTVDPTLHEIPTIDRLKAAGKTDETLHVSTTDHVVDTTGKYKDPDGNPYQYLGHWSWIYFDNNECACDTDGMKAWDFIAEHVK